MNAPGRASFVAFGLLGAFFAGACGGSESHDSTRAVDGGDASAPVASGGASGAAGKGGETTAGGSSASAGGVTSPGGAAGGSVAASSGGVSASTGGASASAGGTAASSGGTGGAPSTGSCDPRRVVCRSAPPSCPAMQVPSVEGNCWGPCVAIDTCACADAQDCPDSNQYTCNRSAKHCTPYLE